MQRDDDILSPDAAWIFATVFLTSRSALQYNMQNHVPSPEMQTVLDELVNAGKLVREMNMDDMPAHGEAVRYRVADGSDHSSYRSDYSLGWLKQPNPPIRLFIPKEAKA